MNGREMLRGKTLWILIVLATAGTLGLAGCGGGETPKQKITLPAGPGKPLEGMPDTPDAKLGGTPKKASPKAVKGKPLSGLH